MSLQRVIFLCVTGLSFWSFANQLVYHAENGDTPSCLMHPLLFLQQKDSSNLLSEEKKIRPRLYKSSCNETELVFFVASAAERHAC